jgi:hypothetical protein
MQLNLPQTPASATHMMNVSRANLEKFRRFSEQIMSPSSIAEIIQS